jgi:hypothetical protein
LMANHGVGVCVGVQLEKDGQVEDDDHNLRS